MVAAGERVKVGCVWCACTLGTRSCRGVAGNPGAGGGVCIELGAGGGGNVGLQTLDTADTVDIMDTLDTVDTMDIMDTVPVFHAPTAVSPATPPSSMRVQCAAKLIDCARSSE